jgi:uncharacterized SAM-binding protein YcdF (DUF218 family)
MMRARRERRVRRLLLNLTVAAITAAGLWTWGLFRFVEAIPTTVGDMTTPTDGIVVLTGGTQRLGEGLDLLSRDLAKKLFVSGVYQGIDVRALLQAVKRRPGAIEERIAIGNATNTTGNAVETSAWIAEQKYNSLRLVTGAYHMPRSLLEFRHAMPTVTLLPHPVFPGHVKRDRWWAWPGTANLLIGEYTKYLFAWSRLKIAGLLSNVGQAIEGKFNARA